jgi:hypothetical protein
MIVKQALAFVNLECLFWEKNLATSGFLLGILSPILGNFAISPTNAPRKN